MTDLFEIPGEKYREENLGRYPLTKREAIANSTKRPQAIVNIPCSKNGKGSGYSHDASSINSYIDYITRQGDLDAEMEFKTLTYEQAMEKGKWWKLTDQSNPKKRIRLAMKLTLSAPEGSDPKAVKKAAKAFAGKTFVKHEWVSVLHTDTDNPHVHLMVQMQGIDGMKLNPKKKELIKWGQDFSNELNKEGVMTISTSAYSRGLGKKTSRAESEENRPYVKHGNRYPMSDDKLTTLANQYYEISKKIGDKDLSQQVKNYGREIEERTMGQER